MACSLLGSTLSANDAADDSPGINVETARLDHGSPWRIDPSGCRVNLRVEPEWMNDRTQSVDSAHQGGEIPMKSL
jgi:hypothetical protein